MNQLCRVIASHPWLARAKNQEILAVRLHSDLRARRYLTSTSQVVHSWRANPGQFSRALKAKGTNARGQAINDVEVFEKR